MNIQELKEYLNKEYFKDDQKLLLETGYDIKDQKKHGGYHTQAVYYKDIKIIEISTLYQKRYYDNLGSIPYCIRGGWEYFEVTVQKFEELTNEDIEKAINYVFKRLNIFFIFNIYLNNKHINTSRLNDYSFSNSDLRYYKDIIK